MNKRVNILFFATFLSASNLSATRQMEALDRRADQGWRLPHQGAAQRPESRRCSFRGNPDGFRRK